MKTLVDRLDAWLRNYRPRYHQQLLPGRTESELDAFEDSLGFGVPQSFKDLYLWRNGQRSDCSDAFQYNTMFRSLEDAAESRTIMNELLESGGFEGENRWNARWVPFMAHHGGDLLCVDMDGSFGGKPGQLLYFYHDSEDRVIRFPSLEKWLEAFVTTLESGMWEEDEYGFQPKDDDQVMASAKQWNPGYPIYCKADR
ncbi:SMI1/KNR4 family protein [Paludisphaera mucosa]|uniref:SMI1/KNR4 family protein n=1 Tax=Paludisphaera mucosa TaxID=3030827 RepID=A0ABT6FIB8_9BACT|nr:SMI1/KNR4 family protein [Paludisphaera mucosa]MDG3007320.1 SMI1/KNR4 family protein [Paludisphaera mucosa]